MCAAAQSLRLCSFVHVCVMCDTMAGSNSLGSRFLSFFSRPLCQCYKFAAPDKNRKVCTVGKREINGQCVCRCVHVRKCVAGWQEGSGW